MKSIPKLSFLAAIAVLLLFSCSKSDNNTVAPVAESFIVYKNQSTDVNADALQAQYKDPNKGFDINFYGGFDTDKNPTNIKTITFQKTNNDTVVNLIIDPITSKIASTFYSVKGVKSPIVIKFDYIDDSTTNFSFYNYNWVNKTGTLFYATQVENINGVKTGSPFYTGRRSGINYNAWIDAVLIAMILIPPILVVGEVVVVVGGGLATAATGTYGTYAIAAGALIGVIIPSDSHASDIIHYPTNIITTNPVPVENNPIPHLPITSCVNTQITFTATMDATGAIIFTTINGGQAPYTYMVESGFQQSTVFGNNYANGSYLLAVKDANGCVNMKVIPLSRATATLKIGDAYQGGIIGYLDSTGLHGLIVSPSDQGTTQWEPKDESQMANVITSTDIGTGNANTIALSAFETYAISPAKLCTDLKLGGYEDWYLPSRDELYQVVNNLKLIGFTKDSPYYISSSRAYSYSGNVYFVYFTSDTQIGVNSGSWRSDFRVRAVRSF